MIIIAIIGILATIAVPLYAPSRFTPTFRCVLASPKDQADVRALGSAVSILMAHIGVVPIALAPTASAPPPVPCCDL